MLRVAIFYALAALVNVVLADKNYCKVHANHTLCLHKGSMSSSCGEIMERGLTPEERILVTKLHNDRRSFIAMGLEKRGDPGPQPPAANMMELTYDEELELEAQTWTDQCVRGHDCPDCRTLPRFKVGQNLFWYGHFVGSWERSVAGWYDEVVDFNSSFVYPFYVIPGVLVGHYTQMTWAQSTKVGCGKLFALNPPPSTASADGFDQLYGHQFFICNYGLAGNLIKSEMYRAGQPCSACPPGTSCSSQFPGLCSGVPLETLTVRPPVNIDLTGYPAYSDSRFGRTNATAELQILPPILVEKPRPPPNAREECEYSCEDSGGCSVRFSSTLAFYSGSILGSCFPPSFGGECSGTPEKCSDCSGVCNGKKGVKISVELNKSGKSGQPKETVLSDVSHSTDGKEDSGASSSGGNDDSCSYNCNPRGGCSVRINSLRMISGSVLGSCFSRDFGGKCSGTPKACKDCLEICEEMKKEGGELVLPASH